METETLAHKLGTTTHDSGLLRKARRLGLSTPESLELLAVSRGCRYYGCKGEWDRFTDKAVMQMPSVDVFNNVELAMALLSIVLPTSQWRLRIGAAMLAAEGNTPEALARLAIHERSEKVVSYIAQCGRQVEPDNPFWDDLLTRLPDPAYQPPPDVLPHLTRFVAMTGVTRSGRETVMQWIRPTLAAA